MKTLFEKLTNLEKNATNTIYVIPDDETTRWFIEEVLKTTEEIFSNIAIKFNLASNHIFPKKTISNKSSKVIMKNGTKIDGNFSVSEPWIFSQEYILTKKDSNTYVLSDLILTTGETQNDEILAFAKSISIELKPIKKHGFMLDDAPLNERQRKYCTCILEVQAKGKVSNPYPICAKSVGTTYRSCSKYYDWLAMDVPELLAWMNLHDVTIPKLHTRENLVTAIRKWKIERGYK